MPTRRIVVKAKVTMANAIVSCFNRVPKFSLHSKIDAYEMLQ